MTHSSTVSLLGPLDEFSYIQIESSSSRDSFGRECILDSSYNIVSVLSSGKWGFLHYLDTLGLG